MAEPEYMIRDFKGHSIGYNYDENTDTYTWFVIEPPNRKNPETQRGFSRITFGGEWAAQAARIRFLDNINGMFERYFKKEFEKLGIDPGSGRRIPNDNTVGKLQGSGIGKTEQGIQGV